MQNLLKYGYTIEKGYYQDLNGAIQPYKLY